MNIKTDFDLNHSLDSFMDVFLVTRSVDKVRGEVVFTLRLGTIEGSVKLPLEKYLRLRDWNPRALSDMLATEMHHISSDWLLQNKSAYLSSISENDDFFQNF